MCEISRQRGAAADCVLGSVCLPVCHVVNVCKQDNLKKLIFGSFNLSQITFNIAQNERPKICNFHTSPFLSGVSGALW